MQEQNGIEKPIIFISHILSDQATLWNWSYTPSSIEATHSLLDGQTIYGEERPQKSCLSIEFVDSKVGPLESPTFGIQISRPTHSGSAKRRGRWTHSSHESIQRGNSELKASSLRGGPYPTHFSVRRGRVDDS